MHAGQANALHQTSQTQTWVGSLTKQSAVAEFRSLPAACNRSKETGELIMQTNAKKPASLWLKLTVLASLLVGLTVAYETVSTSGEKYFPSVRLTANKIYTLRLKGATGLRFCGEISVTRANGKVATHKLDGVVPETFKMFGTSVSVTFTKCEENGLLDVAIVNSDNCGMEKSTTGRYGTINIKVN